MKILLKDNYKSLQSFESETLNSLTVITGKNGSGKSQLLTLIAAKAKNDPSVAAIRLELDPAISSIQSEGIIKENSSRISHDHWRNIVNSKLGPFRALSPSVRKLCNFIVTNELQAKARDDSRQEVLSHNTEYLEALSKTWAEIRSVPPPSFDQINPSIERKVLRQVFSVQNEQVTKLANEICASTGKIIDDLTDADFYNTPIKEHMIDSSDLFSSQVELIFYNYAKRRDQNRKNWFYKNEEGIANNSTSDADFINKYIPPWIAINDILDRHSIDFHFKGIEKTEFSVDAQIDFNLYKKTTEQVIPFGDLSSGEKVIIGLILKLFTSEYYGKDMTFPELLILDEPDAHLHPEMSKLLLDVLRETFALKFRINVIITTHSPSTIALAEENEIFQLKNGLGSSLNKIAKDEALKILTEFLPTLSIDYKNHRQVFVESPTDVTYFQYLHDKHYQSKPLPYKLYFISNSPGKSNCSQVYSIVEAIRNSGNSTAYGIVDWDLNNDTKPFICVHGQNERYSIENFILDPIYLICLLIDMNNAHGISEKIGINRMYNQYLLGNESSERLQSMVAVFFAEFEAKFSQYRYESERVDIEYLNGKRVSFPKWYLVMRGHDIADKVKVIFPALANKYRSEGDLQNVLTVIMSKCYPFVPLTSIKTIEAIGNIG